jgi:hypothetical protein
MLKIKKIKLLCLELPLNDKLRALQFIEDRNFEDLELLIKSIITLIELNNLKVEPSKELSNLDETKIMELYNLVLEYKSQLNIEDDY